jgi:hypothetical protein
MQWWFFRRMVARGFNMAKSLLSGYQKIDTIQVVTFRWVHALGSAGSPSTA